MSNTLPATPLFLRDGRPTTALQELLACTGMGNETDAETIHGLTQQHWRKYGMQAAEIAEEDAGLLDVTKPIFQRLGLIGVPDIRANSRADWVVVLGATYTAVHKRIAHLSHLEADKHITWDHAAYLGSRRGRFPDKEPDQVITKPVEEGLLFAPRWTVPAELPEDEAGLISLIREQIGNVLPGLDPSQDRIVIAENRPDGSPAGTRETLEAFARECDPQGKRLLIVSSQPHILRQTAEAAAVLGNRFRECIGTGYDVLEKHNVTHFLDEIAKAIHVLFSRAM